MKAKITRYGKIYYISVIIGGMNNYLHSNGVLWGAVCIPNLETHDIMNRSSYPGYYDSIEDAKKACEAFGYEYSIWI